MPDSRSCASHDEWRFVREYCEAERRLTGRGIFVTLRTITGLSRIFFSLHHFGWARRAKLREVT